MIDWNAFCLDLESQIYSILNLKYISRLKRFWFAVFCTESGLSSWICTFAVFLCTGSDGQLLRDLLKAADGIDWLQDSLAQLEACYVIES